jgi:hypothetical protein
MRDMLRLARVAQLVEQRIENPRVGGSNPSPGTIFGGGERVGRIFAFAKFSAFRLRSCSP